jgi:hypothetical protein
MPKDPQTREEYMPNWPEIPLSFATW